MRFNLTDKIFRYERKFQIETLDRPQVQAWVKKHPGFFYSPFPPRYINNLYLDTADLHHYQDNVIGTGNRKKIRIRWYGDLLGNIQKPVLEFKIKEGLVGTKFQYPIQQFTMKDIFNQSLIRKTLLDSDIPEQIKLNLKFHNVVLLNRYYRSYFATRDNVFRITIDSNLTYYQVRPSQNPLIHKNIDRKNIILEIKYDMGQERTANTISAYFPFPVTKMSKYIQGIERVYPN
ncbi:MAG: VTC domain-containing protein [Anaerolineaceae bacterium]|nr:VTC domain-containing protein [Anaerolineaceae bacterium]